MAKKYPIFFNGTNIVLSSKEREFVDYLVQSGEIPEAAKKAGIPLPEAKEFLKSERIRLYVQHKVGRVARRNDITLDSVLDRLHKIAWGELRVTRYEMRALEILSHFLNILKPPQTNLNLVKIEKNPLEQASDEELESMIKKRIENAKPVNGHKS